MKRIDFENGTVTNNILSAALPMLVAQILNLLYNIVDRIYIARIHDIGTTALGAVGLCFPIIMIITAFSNLFGSGGAPIFSINRGKGDSRTADMIMNTAFTMLCGSAAVLMLIGFLFARPLLTLFGASDDALVYAYPYLMIYLLGTLPSMIATGMNPFINAQGYAIIGMLSVTVGAVANIILDPIFIFGYFGLPAMGVTGAALATIIGQFGAAILSIYLFSRHNEHIHISFKHFKIDFQVFKNLYSIAIPSGVMMCLPSVLVSILNGVLATISQTAVAFFGVYFKLQTFVYMPANGVIQGLRPIMSYNYGAKQKDRMDQSIKAAGLTIATILTLGTLLFSIFPTQILSLFNANQAMLEIGISGLRILSISFVLSTFGILMSGVFESLGKGNYSLIISLLRQFIIIIPLSLLFISHIGLSGVWLTFPLSESIASLIALILFIKVYKRINLID